MTLEDGAVFIKDPDKFKEFKKTREEEMVEEDKLRRELKKPVNASDLVPTLKYPLTYESEVGKEIMADKELLKTAGGKALVKQMEKNKGLPLANPVPMKLLRKIENKEFLESLTEEEIEELKIHKSKKAILEARRQRAKEEKK